MEKLDKLIRKFDDLKRERRSWEPFWRDVRDYVVPKRGRGLDGDGESETNDGRMTDGKRINGAATRALGVLASGMQSGLTSKARQWFVLNNPDPDIDRRKSVRQWYESVQEVLEGVFRRSNVYQAFRHSYEEMGAFGQGPILVPEHPDKVLYCRPFTAGTYWMDSDPYGDIDTFMYREYMTPRQLALAYGEDALPQDVKNALGTGRNDMHFEIVNAIMKHPGECGFGLRDGMEACSVHFMPRHKERPLRVSYYQEWPVMTPRWDVIDSDVYGQSPVRDIIGDVKSLQAMAKEALKATAKGTNPPMAVPPEIERRGLNVQPGGLNVVSAPNSVQPLYIPAVNIQQLQLLMESTKQDIKSGLYNDLFLALLTQDNPQMTAREVAERHEEKLLMLGPVLDRIHSELLDPLIWRAYSLAARAGLIPPPPPELEGPMQIEYVSILSQAQKAVGVGRIEQSVGFMSGLVAVYPEVRHALDPYKVFSEYNRMIGVKESVMVPKDEYDKAVKEEAESVLNEKRASYAEPLANAAKAVSEVDRANMPELLAGGMGGSPL